jgi:hypothetical protein
VWQKLAVMRRSTVLGVLVVCLAACRFLAPPASLPSRDGPGLMANGNSGDPTRAQPIPGNRCGVDCGPGAVCDQQSATCVPAPVERTPARDAGPAWLP